jgi:hemolysin activation/secretion protein
MIKKTLINSIILAEMLIGINNKGFAMDLNIPFDAGTIQSQQRELPIPQSKPKSFKDIIVSDKSKPENAKKLFFVLKEILIKGNKVYKNDIINQFSKQYLNKQINLDDIYKIAEEITNFYRNNGYITTKTDVPKQNINKGIVTLEIIEGYVDSIDFVDKNFVPTKIMQLIIERIKASEVFNIKKLEEEMLRLNDLGGYNFKASIKPSTNIEIKEKGGIDIIIEVNKQNNNGVINYNNGNSKLIDKNNFSAQYTINNSLFNHHHTTLALNSSLNLTQMNNASIQHSLPIDSKGSSITYSLQHIKVKPGNTLEKLKIKSSYSEAAIGIKHNLVRSRTKTFALINNFILKNEKLSALNQKLHNNTYGAVDFGGIYDFSDTFKGANIFNISAQQQIGNVYRKVLSSNLSWDKKYNKLLINYARMQNIYGNLNFYFEASQQYSEYKLPSNAKLSYGGYAIGRGYQSGEISGIRGLSSILELRYLKKFQYLNNPLEFYIFFDNARLSDKNSDNIISNFKASSTGFGVSFKTKYNLSHNLFYAKPLIRTINTSKKQFVIFYSLSLRL